MSRIENEFSWSVTRDRMFRTCRRRYFFHYYGSWGGWKAEAEKRTRLIYILKNLQSRQMWAGRKVHESIERMLKLIREGKTVNEKAVTDRILLEMRKEFLSSRKKAYMQNPKTCALYEHEYGLPVSDAEWKRNAEHAVDCLQRFFRSRIYQKIQRLKSKNWLDLENLSYFGFHGVKVFVMLDLAFREGDTFFIYDWKTGKEDRDNLKLQMACYGLYAGQKWYAAPENIHLTEYYLHRDRENSWILTDLDREKAQNYIRDSIAGMMDLLEDSQSNRAVEKRFSLTRNEKLCRFCNFYRVCPRFAGN